MYWESKQVNISFVVSCLNPQWWWTIVFRYSNDPQVIQVAVALAFNWFSGTCSWVSFLSTRVPSLTRVGLNFFFFFFFCFPLLLVLINEINNIILSHDSATLVHMTNTMLNSHKKTTRAAQQSRVLTASTAGSLIRAKF